MGSRSAKNPGGPHGPHWSDAETARYRVVSDCEIGQVEQAIDGVHDVGHALHAVVSGFGVAEVVESQVAELRLLRRWSLPGP